MTFRSKELKVLHWFYPILFFVFLLQAMGYIPPKGMPGEGVYIWPFRLTLIYFGLKAFIKNYTKCIILTIYIIYSLFSFALYAFNGYPIKLYIFDIAFYLSSILFAYVGMDNSDDSDKFREYTFYAIIVAFGIGLYLFFFNPSWYQDAWVINYNSRWYKYGMNADFDFISANMRFSSFFMSSYATEYYGLFALPFALCGFMKEKKGKKRNVYMFCSLFILLVLVLSMQRAAIISAILMLIIFAIYDMTHNHSASSFYIYLLIGSIVLVGVYSTSELGGRVLERFGKLTISDTFSEARISQNEDLLGVWNNLIFGNGLGTGGNEARKMGYPAVTDSNYVKILVEQGIIGFLFFFSFIIATCKRIISNFRYLAFEGAFFASILVAMVGSNSLMFSLYIPPFWYSVGRIWNDNYINDLKKNNKYI